MATESAPKPTPIPVLADRPEWNIPGWYVYRFAGGWFATRRDDPAMARDAPTWDELQGRCTAAEAARAATVVRTSGP
jgi:hypothetical protein